MLGRGFKRFLLLVLKFTIFAVLFIDATQTQLAMNKFTGFAMPSKEEMDAKRKDWEDKLLGKFLVDERQLTPAALADEPAAPSDEPAVPSDKPTAPSGEQEEDMHPWLVEVSGVKKVKASLIPGPVRAIWPGTPVTRDLRPSRLNISCDKEGLIISVGFY
ncbi:hypothetical protein LPJ61_003759 [Coemansia biformis]|uniref:Uncharacterized protein n=1 Tax=Coemansia biformis TaxID=1286918 RepID=A0A9W8CXE2_9FUNG|nr:hypothetical protein LPJ61_003759 [Coemansia biformis]